MSMAINCVMSNYTYSYGNALRPKLDKDNDGYWSKAEVTTYAKAYEKATGNKLDVDKLMSTYDTNNEGKLDFKAQEKIYKDDALNLKALTQPKTQSTGAGISETLADMMATMSTSSKIALSSMVYSSEQKSNLLYMFGNRNSMFDFSSIMNNYQNYKYQSSMGNLNAYVGQMMNMFV